MNVLLFSINPPILIMGAFLLSVFFLLISLKTLHGHVVQVFNFTILSPTETRAYLASSLPEPIGFPTQTIEMMLDWQKSGIPEIAKARVDIRLFIKKEKIITKTLYFETTKLPKIGDSVEVMVSSLFGKRILFVL